MSEEKLEVLQPSGAAKPATPSPLAIGVDENRTPRVPEELSILPVRGMVIFPGTVMPLTVSRAASIKLLDETLPITKTIGMLTQRDEEENPNPQDLYHIGTAVMVLKLLRQADDR